MPVRAVADWLGVSRKTIRRAMMLVKQRLLLVCHRIDADPKRRQGETNSLPGLIYQDLDAELD